jgi:ribosomal protein L37E
MVHERFCRQCGERLVHGGELCVPCVFEARRMRVAAERAARDEKADAVIAAKFDPKATPVLPFGRRGKKRVGG